MRIGDPNFYAKLTELLQSRDPLAIPDLIDPDQIGLTISIPAELLLSRARRQAADAGPLSLKTVANPGAGNDWVFTVPTGRLYHVRAINCLFTTSAAVANRRVRLIADDGTTGIYVMPAPIAQGASEGWDHSWAVGAPVISGASGSGDLAASRTLPLLLLPAGYRLRTAVANIQAADAFTNIRVQVEDFPA